MKPVSFTPRASKYSQILVKKENSSNSKNTQKKKESGNSLFNKLTKSLNNDPINSYDLDRLKQEKNRIEYFLRTCPEETGLSPNIYVERKMD